MTPSTVRPALRTLMAALTGLDESRIFWGSRPRGYTGPRYIVLRLSAPVAQGKDEVWYEYDAARDAGTPSAFDELEPKQTGLRSVTLKIQCWSHAATDADDALELALAIQDAIQLPAHQESLEAVDIAVAGLSGPFEIPTKQDGRELSVYALDARLNALSAAAGTRIGYVEHWGVTGDATIPDGVPSVERFINDEVMP